MGHLFLPYFWHLPVLRLPRILGKAFQKRTKTQERILHQRSQTRKVHIAVAVTITNHQRRFQLPESARVIILQKRKPLPTSLRNNPRIFMVNIHLHIILHTNINRTDINLNIITDQHTNLVTEDQPTTLHTQILIWEERKIQKPLDNQPSCGSIVLLFIFYAINRQIKALFLNKKKKKKKKKKS